MQQLCNVCYHPTVPAAVSSVVLVFDTDTITNSVSGMISVLTRVTWNASPMPNGIITSHSVTLVSEAGITTYSRKIDWSLTELVMTATIVPNDLYRAVVKVFNSAGSRESNSSFSLSPQGGTTVNL